MKPLWDAMPGLMSGVPFRGVVCQNKKEENNVAKYIVWNPNSQLPPRVVHDGRPQAIRVAGHMAHSNPGETFYVCKLTNSAYKPKPVPVPEVTYVDLAKDEEVPF